MSAGDFPCCAPENDPDRIPTYGELIAQRHTVPTPEDASMAVSLDLLALTADYPVDHPLRQAAARLTTRLALAEGKIATAVALIDPDAYHMGESLADQLLEILRR